MSKNINVNLQFSANTANVKAQLQSLQTQLQNLNTTALNQANVKGYTDQLQRATAAAGQLSAMLKSATNVDTGQLNLSQFSQSLKTSGQDLAWYRRQLIALGPAGDQAFLSLARSISSAQAPLRATSTMLDKMWTTLSNTIRWQISAQAIQAFTGAISGAFSYAKNLNESLNNIRIVTQQSADQMEKFAEKANKAAKALSTTTNEYAKASLIYYQQGLDDAEVAERTNTTIKLANVTGESAETVSEWMTAIWNNFDDGSKSLEYYADVLTKLGAATASSADEIAGGLEKFSAVADAVGLSYEYATSALATITAQTRQSEDVVGTALKTIFARMQNLKLGETTEDGETLGQYSAALEKIGVKVLDSTGNLRDMNTVLMDLGNTWGNLTKAQQIATAQSVAGIRQYNQLIALMDNFEIFKQNVVMAENSSTALEQQANIYAESWEAASNRVSASAETIYDNLINDDFMIDAMDTISKFLDGINKVIDSMGGLYGFIPLIVSGITAAFGPKILTMVRNFRDQLSLTSKKSLELAMATKQSAIAESTKLAQQGFLNKENTALFGAQSHQAEIQNLALNAERELTAQEQTRLNIALDTLKTQEVITVSLGKQLDQQRLESEELKKQIDYEQQKMKFAFGNNTQGYRTTNIKTATAARNMVKASQEQDPNQRLFYERQAQNSRNEAVKSLTTTGMSEKQASKFIDELIAKRMQYIKTTKNATMSEKDFEKALKNMEKTAKEAKNSLDDLGQIKFGDRFVQGVQGVSSLTFALSSLTSAYQSLSKLWNPDEDFTFDDFLSVAMGLSMAIPMISSGLASLKTAFAGGAASKVTDTIATNANTKAAIKNWAVKNALSKTTDQNEKEHLENAAAIKFEEIALEDLNEEQLKKIGIEKLDNGKKGWNYKSSKTGKKLRGTTTIQDAIGDGSANNLTGFDSAKEALKGKTQGAGRSIKSFGKNIGTNAKGIYSSIGGGAGLAAGAMIIGGIAVAATSLALYVKAVNKTKDALNHAKEAASAASTNLEQVNQEAEKINNTITGYRDAQKSLDGLVKGTLEYKQALIESNQKALELINSSEALRKMGEQGYTTIDGEIVISEAGLKAVQEEQVKKQQSALMSSQYANRRVQQAQQNYDQEQLLKKTKAGINDNDERADLAAVGMGAGAGMAAGGALIAGASTVAAVNAWNPVGWVTAAVLAAAAVGTAIYGAVEGSVEQIEEDAMAQLQKEYGAQGGVTEQDLDNFFEAHTEFASLKDSFTENIDAINNLIQSNEELKAVNEMVAQQEAETAVQSLFVDEIAADPRIGGALAEIAKNTIKEKEQTKNDLISEIDNQDDLLIKFYEALHEGDTLKEMGGKEILISRANGAEQHVQQADIAKQIADDIALAAYSGDESTLKELETAITNASGVSETNKADIRALIENLKIEAEVRAQLDTVQKTVNKLATATSLNGMENAVAVEKIATQLAKETGEQDFTFLTREQLEELTDMIDQFDQDTQEKIKNGIETYEKRLKEANYKISELYNETVVEAEQAAKIQSAAQVSSLEFDAYVDNLSRVANINEQTAEEVVLNNLQIQTGLTKLIETFEKYGDALDKSKEGTLDYSRGIASLKQNFLDWFGVTLKTETVEKNIEVFRKAINGSKEAVKDLQDLAAREIIIDFNLPTNKRDEIMSIIKEIQNQDIKIGVSLDDNKALKKLATLYNSLIEAGLMTTEQASRSLSLLGANVQTKKVESYYSEYYDEDKKQGKKNAIAAGLTAAQYEMRASGEGKRTLNLIDLETSYFDGNQFTNDAFKPTEEERKAREERIKSLKNEVDRYHEINEIISDTERELERLGKAKDRAFGSAKLALMKDEIDKQKELIKNNEELLRQAQKYAEQDKKELIANTASNLSIQFDEYGRIANYEDLQDSYIKRLKSNANNEEKYNNINKEYEAFKEAASKYEESLNKVEGQAEILNDQLDELYSKNLEKIEYNVQIKVDMADDDKAYIDFLMQKIEDDAFAAADAIELLGRETETIMQKIAANQQGIEDVQAMVANGDITPEKGTEKLRQYRDELIDLNADLLEVRQTVQEKLTEAFEAWNEKIEQGTSKIEFYGSVLEGYQNIIDIAGKDMLGISDETMIQLYKTMESNANDALRSTKAQLDANEATLKAMREARAEADANDDQESVEEWDKQIKIAEEKSRELTTTLQDNLSTSLEATAKTFGAVVNQIADDFSKTVSGIYNSIEEMRESWDRQQEVSDRFLETYEQTYELNKLNRQIQNSIEKTDNVGSQKELRDLQAEMQEMAKDGQQLSKYDLEYLQKKYDLMVAEQALRDAQNTKSVVRLTRDSEGNFGYTYTADQNAIDDAQQNYEDKLYAFQQYSDEMDKALAEMYIAVQEQAYERMQAAAEMYGEGTEAFERERKKILDQYNTDMGYITDEYSKLTDRNLHINENFNAGVADTYEKTFLNSIVPHYKDFESLYAETTNKCKDSCDLLSEAIVALESTFKTQLGNAGIDADTFENTVKTELGKVQSDSQTTANEIEQMAKDMNTALNGPDGAIKKVAAFQQSFSGYMEQVRNNTSTTIQTVNELITAYGKLAEAAGKDYTPETKPPETLNGGKNDDNDIDKIGNTDLTSKITISKFGGTLNAKTGEWQYVQLSNGNWYNASHVKSKKIGDEVEGWAAWKTVNYDEPVGPTVQKTSHTAKSASDWWKDLDTPKYGGRDFKIINGETYIKAKTSEYWYKEKELDSEYRGQTVPWEYNRIKKGQQAYTITGLDTGGYTGEWGPEGRLAMLHQKEIVLNAHDTENFLTAIGIVRDISDQIEKNAIVMQYQNQLANYRASVGNSGETLQQEVHITAEFPNATNHSEIEEAFRNLTNLASQYANRKF